MKRIIFMPYKMGSSGAKKLAEAVGAKRSKGLKRLKRDVIVCNWGRSELPVRGRPYRVLNAPDKVIQATNKLMCLNRLQQMGVPRVEHTTNKVIALQWLAQGNVVYCRMLLNSSQGNGIVLIKPGETNVIPDAPMYTKGIPKSHEYRVHVFRNQILDVTKKRRRSDAQASEYIKNLSNGWVFCRNNIDIPDNLLECAKKAIAALGLDFGAVDMLYRQGLPYVLEVNTAPGLEGTTLVKYAQVFNQLKYW